MSAPTLKVEFAYDKFNNDYVWNDVSSLVKSVSVGRGVSREIDSYSAGQASVTFQNNKRQFDPTYLDVLSTRTNLWRNPSVQYIPTGGSAPSSTDYLFGNVYTSLFSSIYSYVGTNSIQLAISSATPSVKNGTRHLLTSGATYTFSAYVLNQAGDTTQWQSIATYFADATTATASGSFTGSATTTANGTTWTRVSQTITVPPSGLYYEFRVQGISAVVNHSAYVDAFMLEQSATLGSYFDGDTNDGPNSSSTWADIPNISNSVQTIYKTLYGMQVKPAGALRITSNSSVIFYGFIDNWSFDYPESGFNSIAVVTAFDGLSNLAKASLDVTTNTSSSTGARINGILNKAEVNYPSAFQDIDGGSSTVQGDTLAAGTNALTYMQQVARSEPGDLFVARDGKITFRDKRWLDTSWNLPTYRTNLIMNPSFESNASTKWTVKGAVTSAFKQVGTYSLTAFLNGPLSIYNAVYVDTDASKFALNTDYYISAWVYSPTGRDIYMQASFYNGGTTGTAGPFSSATITVPAATWTRIDLAAPVNSGGSAMDTIELYFDGSSAFGVFYIDAVLMEAASTLGSYFDGTYVPSATATTRYTSIWNGVTNLSTSTLATQTLETNPTVSPIILGDYFASGIPYTDIKISYNSENLFNRVQLQRTAGSVQISQDTSLQDDYGIRTFSATDLLNTTDAAVLLIGNELLTAFSQMEMRAEEVTVQVHALGTIDQNTILDSDIRSVAQITMTPMRTGVSMTKFYSIIGVRHEIQNQEHVVTYSVASLQNQPFRLNSAVTGVLDTNTLGY